MSDKSSHTEGLDDSAAVCPVPEGDLARRPSDSEQWPEAIVIGYDAEVSNFILPGDGASTCREASRRLLVECEGIPAQAKWDRRPAHYSPYEEDDPAFESSSDWWNLSSSNPQDVGRKFLPSSGGAVYIDLDHLEFCLGEVSTAHQFVASLHAMYRHVEQARRKANRRLRDGRKVVVLFNSSDGQNHSYGLHINCLIPRLTFDQIFFRKSSYVPFLASYFAASSIVCGEGKCGSENGRSPVGYQIARRMDFMEAIRGIQTTIARPLVNERDESHTGWSNSSRGSTPREEMARLHVIPFDANLCHASNFLKIGTLQIVLAMLQREHACASLILDDPVEAAVAISHDPSLEARVETIGGSRLTALEWMLEFCEEANRFAARGGCDGLVPGFRDILDLLEDTLAKLKSRDWAALARRLDWVLKRTLLEKAMTARPKLNWASPEIQYLDQIYSSSDPCEGLYWACEAAGAVDRLVTPGEIGRASTEPPHTTRAYMRSKILQLAGSQVEHVNWDTIRLRLRTGRYTTRYVCLDLPDPRDFNYGQMGWAFENAATIEEAIDRLERSSIKQDRSEASTIVRTSSC